MSTADANATVAGNAVRCDMVVVLFESIDGFRGSVGMGTRSAGCEGRLELAGRARWNTPRGAAVEGSGGQTGGLLSDEPDGLADLVELCHRRGCGAAFLARLHHDALTVQV